MPFQGTYPHASSHQENIGTDPLSNYGYFSKVRRTQKTTTNANPTQFSGISNNTDNTLQSGHGWTLSNSPSGNLNYTSDFIIGSQCVLLVSNGTSQAIVKSPRMTAVNLTGKMIRLWLKFDAASYANILAVNFYVGSGASAFLNNAFTAIGAASMNSLVEFAKAGEWVCFTFNPCSFNTISGTMDWTAVQDFQVAIKDPGAGSHATILFGGIDFIPNDTTYPNGVVTLAFDDNFAGQLTYALPKMAQYGYKGTFYPIVDTIGSSGTYMTQTQIDRLATLGHEIAFHSYYAADHGMANGFASLTDQQLYTDIALGRAWIHDKGYVSSGYDHMALAQGFQDTTLLAKIKTQFAATRLTTPRSIETLPVADPYRLRAWTIAANASRAVTPNSTVGTAEWYLDQIALYGGWYIMYTHDMVASGASGNLTNQTDFNNFVDYVATKGIPVRTIGDVLGL